MAAGGLARLAAQARSCGGRRPPAAGDGQLGIHILQRVLDVGEFLVELAQASLQVRDVVGEALHLRAHGVQARAGSRGEILRILLNGGHAER